VAELGESGTPSDLIPGDPDAIAENVVAIRGRGHSMVAAGNGLASIDSHSWRGQAGNEFREKFSYEPARWRNAGDSFEKAAVALENYSGTLRWAQGQATEAIHHWDAGEAATRKAKSERLEMISHINQENDYNLQRGPIGSTTQIPIPPFADPGESLRQAAREILQRARQQVAEVEDRASKAIWAEGDTAPETSLWNDFLDAAGELGSGIADPFVSAGKTIYSMSGINAFWDDDFDRPMVTAAQNAAYLATHPVEFAKAMVDWNTWADSPARAIGHLLGNFTLAGVAGKVVAELSHIPTKAPVVNPLGPGVKTIDPPPLSFPKGQIEKKYDDHAKDFFVNDPRGKVGFKKFEEAVKEFFIASKTMHIDGTYRGDPMILNYNPSGETVLLQKHDGTFVSGWKLSESQIRNVMERGALQ
jgi:hypothetical protein